MDRLWAPRQGRGRPRASLRDRGTRDHTGPLSSRMTGPVPCVWEVESVAVYSLRRHRGSVPPQRVTSCYPPRTDQGTCTPRSRSLRPWHLLTRRRRRRWNGSGAWEKESLGWETLLWVGTRWRAAPRRRCTLVVRTPGRSAGPVPYSAMRSLSRVLVPLVSRRPERADPSLFEHPGPRPLEHLGKLRPRPGARGRELTYCGKIV